MNLTTRPECLQETDTDTEQDDDMKNLNFSLKQLTHRNRDGSFATQADRERMLSQFATQLHELGFRQMDATSLKPKHVEALLQRWNSENIAASTIKNRVATLRWWADKIGKPNVVPRTNQALGIAMRRYVTNEDKGKDLAAEQLAGIPCERTRLSLRFEAEFGLRREESIKIRPSWADAGNVLRLKDSWTKGGRPREVPITTDAQRALLDEAKRFAGAGSLIAEGTYYRDQLKVFRAHCERVGIHGVHGLRHRYAQLRYEQKTGWKSPAAGGPLRRELTAEQRSIDNRVRLEISLELGHSRVQIVAVYLGS